MELLRTHRSFRKELKKQLRLAITAAIGFSIAYGWRNAIFDSFQSFISRFFDIPLGHYMTEVYTATALTIVGVVLIFITAKLLKED
jgi:putative Mn2+ efflux pump MntP